VVENHVKLTTITLQPIETFYSVFHAAVTDKFGVNRNVVAEEAPAQEGK
jgi:PhnB protein